jgi:type II restriction enzyme
MSRKAELRTQRNGTVINGTSSKQENDLIRALKATIRRLEDDFHVKLYHETQWKLSEVVAHLQDCFPEVNFHNHFPTSSMRPDGGILSILGENDRRHPVLIVEVKNQGTNDLRLSEGKKKQAKGNAIERLGKNVIGFRAALLSEGIMPFLCFGYGCDFASDSSILDRVSTIAMFGELNKICVLNQGDEGQFNRGSFFFRESKWTLEEMEEIMYEVAKRSIHYYFAKFGDRSFVVESTS